jgi:phosphoribosylformylglycinamidine cyclo-ligase
MLRTDPYVAAGVDVAAGDELVRRIAPLAARTRIPGVLDGLGGFAAGYELPIDRMRRPVLVTATDGVGTKLLIAREADRWSTVGIDLVAMCVNDIVCTGATPTLFLDYVATGALDVAQVAQIVGGIADGCSRAGCALVGGETAELPGMYAPGDVDLAGFAIGLVDHDDRLGPHRVRRGDALIGIASSGLHSNGYSLVRAALLRDAALDLDGVVAPLSRTLVDELLEPTALYPACISALTARVGLHAAAHITGGGIDANVARVMPPGLSANIDRASWPTQPIFELLGEHVEDADAMWGVFNMGVGMVVAVDAAHCDVALEAIASAGHDAWVIGDVEEAM